MKNKYLVSWNETITCYHTVEAENEKEAESKALDLSHKNIDTIDIIECDDVEVKKVE